MKELVLFAPQNDDLQALRAELRGREEGSRAKPLAGHCPARTQVVTFGRMVKLATILAADGTALAGAQKYQELARFWKQAFEAEHVHFPLVVAAELADTFVHAVAANHGDGLGH